MEITKVELSYPRKKSFKFRGWAKVTLDGILVIAGIKFFEATVEDQVSRYIIFPEHQPAFEYTNGQTVSIPLVSASEELRSQITEAIFEEYKKRPQHIHRDKKFTPKEEQSEE